MNLDISRTTFVLLAVAAYALVVWAIQRFRLLRARKGGIPGTRFADFDHRRVLDELSELYLAGLPGGGDHSAPPPSSEVPEAGRPVAWWRPAAWEVEDPALPEVVRTARARVLAGHDGQVDALVDPTQEAAVDQRLTSLGIHAFLARLYEGDIDGAERVLARLPAWTNNRISSRIVSKHQAQLALLKARRASGGAAKAFGRASLRHLRRAAATARYADPGTRAMWAHAVLRHGLGALNMELQLHRVDRGVRKALADAQNSPVLFYELAHVCALRGRSEEAVDHLGRALYYAVGDPFYLEVVAQAPEVGRLRPDLYRQAAAQRPRG